jgi:hypothetical protein
VASRAAIRASASASVMAQLIIYQFGPVKRLNLDRMRLAELEPEWIYQKYGHYGRIVGVRFRCPHCKETWLPVLFLNAPDSGPSQPDDEKFQGNHGGKRWARSGLTFEDLTLSPSLEVPDHWHGHVQHGNVTTVSESQT